MLLHMGGRQPSSRGAHLRCVCGCNLGRVPGCSRRSKSELGKGKLRGQGQLGGSWRGRSLLCHTFVPLCDPLVIETMQKGIFLLGLGLGLQI